MMSSKFKERDLQCKILEAEVDSTRRELNEKNKLCKQLGEEIASMKDSEEKRSSSKASIEDNEVSLKGPLEEGTSRVNKKEANNTKQQ